jgi:hypothetical protein
LVHPRPHFFFGAGPSVSHDFAEAKGPGFFLGERTSFAGRIVLGAWWGGTPDAPPPVEASARNAVKAPRFGEPQQVLFTSEAGASLSHSSYSEEATTVTSFSLTPGIDYFVASQVSLGLAAHVGYANEKNGHATTVESTAFAVTPRIGFNVPIAEWVSLYLRGFLQAGVRTYNDELSSVTRNFVAIGIYTPLLLHVASHAFAGFGPYVSHELVNKVPGGSGVQNLATSFGANLIVGAWL